MIDLSTRRKYRDVLRALRAEVPPLHPVVVRMTDLVPPGRPGELIAWSYRTSWPEDGPFRITIRTRIRERGARRLRLLGRSEIVESLAHEWAHCLAWNESHLSLQDHDPLWGVAYARCYNVAIEE